MQKERINGASLAQFNDYINQRKPWMRLYYQQRLIQDLSRQQWDGCFQRNVIAVMSLTYEDALKYLRSLPFTEGDINTDSGMSALTRRFVALFEGFVDEFLLFAVDKHRTSCALSNFPDEHKPSNDYLDRVKREIAERWREFALRANDYFLECR